MWMKNMSESTMKQIISRKVVMDIDINCIFVLATWTVYSY